MPDMINRRCGRRDYLTYRFSIQPWPDTVSSWQNQGEKSVILDYAVKKIIESKRIIVGSPGGNIRNTLRMCYFIYSQKKLNKSYFKAEGAIQKIIGCDSIINNTC
jgi:hypothetical protein